MDRNYSAFSQLSKRMFESKKPANAEPAPKHRSPDEYVLSYFGLNKAKGGEQNGAEDAGAGASVQSLEAELCSAKAEIAALGEAKACAERKAATLERRLAEESEALRGANAALCLLRAETDRLRKELEAAAIREPEPTATVAPPPEVRVEGLLAQPSTEEVFEGEVREHVISVLQEARDTASQSGRERRAKVIGDVVEANFSTGELERRRNELRRIVKEAGSFIDARAMTSLGRLGFKFVSGNKHWKIDYAGVRIPIAKTPSDWRASINTAVDMANRCF